MQLSCLFVNYNSWSLLEGAIASLRRSPPVDRDGAPVPYEIVVVDNASTVVDELARERVIAAVSRIGGVVLLHDRNDGYSAGVNLAFAQSRGRLVLVANPDVVFGDAAITHLLAHFDTSPDIGIVEPAVHADLAHTIEMPAHVVPGPLDLWRQTFGMLSVHGNSRYSARRTRAALRVWGNEAAIDEPMFGGCCFLTSRAVIGRIGLLDERYPLYFEDTDLAMRVRRAGLRIVRLGSARITHLYDRSAATDRALAQSRYEESRRRYFARWHGWAGTAFVWLATRLLGSRWGRARARRVADRPMRTVEWSAGRPLLVLPRRCNRFVVEVAFEPYLFLAAGTFGSGDRWSPSDEVATRLHRDCWFRVVDLDGAAPVELGVWHCPRQEPAIVRHGRADRSTAPAFNRIASDFETDLAQPDYRAESDAVDELMTRFAQQGRRLRFDTARSWEYAHVLVELRRLAAACAPTAPIETILDLGGGNSPLAYLLVERGFRVHVVDVDPQVVAAVRANSSALQWGDRLTASTPDNGRIRTADGSFDCAVCISVVEGVLRKDRPKLFAEFRRTLRPGRSLLLTFDYGADARFVGDPPASIAEVERDLVALSGMELVGDEPGPPEFGPGGPPVRDVVPTIDGDSMRAIAYTFGALHLRRTR